MLLCVFSNCNGNHFIDGSIIYLVLIVNHRHLSRLDMQGKIELRVLTNRTISFAFDTKNSRTSRHIQLEETEDHFFSPG